MIGGTMSFFKRLKESISGKAEAVTNKFKEGLTKTRDAFVNRVDDLFSRVKKSMKISMKNWKKF